MNYYNLLNSNKNQSFFMSMRITIIKLLLYVILTSHNVFSGDNPIPTNEQSRQLITKYYIVLPSEIEFYDKQNLEKIVIEREYTKNGGIAGGALGSVGGGLGGYTVASNIGVATTVGVAGTVAVGVGVGGGIGGFVGSIIGGYIGQNVANRINQESFQWTASSYINIAFHTYFEDNDETVYFCTVKLSPDQGGWLIEKDADKPYMTRAKMSWLIGNVLNGMNNFEDKCRLYDSVFISENGWSARNLANKLKKQHKNITTSDTRIDCLLDEIESLSLFCGNLQLPVSLPDIANAISQLCDRDGDLPVSSYSAKRVKHYEDVINPSVFLCRLLHVLGIPLANTTLSRFLAPNHSGTTILRDHIVSELYTHQGILNINANRKLLRFYYSQLFEINTNSINAEEDR